MTAELGVLPAGIYRHYKGPLYLVLGYADDANADEFHSDRSRADGWSADPLFPEGRNVVVYVGLQLDEAHTGPRMRVRTVEDFFASVCKTEACELYGQPFEGDAFRGCIRCKESPVPRFRYIGPGWDEQR